MKKLFAIAVAVLLTASLFAQAPEKMSYQAVIRDADANLVSNQEVGVRIQILQESEFGAAVYVETQTPTTNENGLMTIEIAGENSEVVSGNFSTIDWGNGIYFIKTEIDITGGTSYVITNTSQLLSVPYTFYAQKAGIAGNAATSETAAVAESVDWEDVDNKPVTLSEMGIPNPVNISAIYPSCKTLDAFDSNYQKLADLGTFTKLNAETLLELMFIGRLAVGTMTGLAVTFELRIDDQATTNKFACATVREEEVGLQGTNATIYGVFNNIPIGSHTVSIWVKATSGTGTNARISPNCFSSVDKVIIKEYK